MSDCLQQLLLRHPTAIPVPPASTSSNASLLPPAAAPHAQGLPHPALAAPADQRPLDSTAATELTPKPTTATHPVDYKTLPTRLGGHSAVLRAVLPPSSY